MTDEGLTYESSGVSIDEQDRAIALFKGAVKATYTPSVLSDVGSFGGLFSANFSDYDDPVLVSSIDGVGTKTRIARLANRYDGLGADIVNHCVNDILVQGARPIFFLDYFAASKLKAEVVSAVVTSAAAACADVGAALIGGEVAEMPGVYAEGESDVVGCIVGVVERSRVMPRSVSEGDSILALPSSGLHTNGFSLARKALLDAGGYSLGDAIGSIGMPLADALLEPHRCYYRELLPHLEGDAITALAHITGGGLVENLPRVVPAGLKAEVDYSSWTPPALFDLIQSAGRISDEQMRRTFNLGVGMAVISPAQDELLHSLAGSFRIGEIVKA